MSVRSKDVITMRNIQFGSNFAVFVLFFGLALLEAFQTRDWLRAGFWLAIAMVFLLADNLKMNKHKE